MGTPIYIYIYVTIGKMAMQTAFGITSISISIVSYLYDNVSGIPDLVHVNLPIYTKVI